MFDTFVCTCLDEKEQKELQLSLAALLFDENWLFSCSFFVN
jgi:hypothetical protein